MNLGKKIEPPPPPPKPDVIERIAPGVIKRNGKMETDKPIPPQPYIPQGWDAVIEAMNKQLADGFPLHEFGVM